MSKQKRKNTMRKPADKMRIVLKGMEPGIDVASLCRLEGISPTQYYTWKKQLVASADAVFGGKQGRTKEVKESRLEADLTRMKNVIAEITAENLELKKTL
jgi:transposase-like protein